MYVCVCVCMSVCMSVCWKSWQNAAMHTCTCTCKRESGKERDGKNNFFNFLIFSILINSTLKKSIVLLFYCYMGFRPAHVTLDGNDNGFAVCPFRTLSLAITGQIPSIVPFMVVVVTGYSPSAGEALANFSRKCIELK